MRNAHELHAAMQRAVQQYQEAEHNVVTLFAEIFRTHAYRELGYAQIDEYMEQAFGFSDSKTRQFLMLARAMQAMPELAEAVQARDLEWTKAVDVARAATPRSAAAWVGKAKSSSRAELRREIQRARTARVQAPSLLDPPAPVLETMSDVRVRMDAVQLERYERALAQLRQRGQSDIESILTGLELQLANGPVCRQTASTAETVIVLHECASCQAAHVKATRGDRALTSTQRAAAHCDATLQQNGKRTRTLPPRARRQTLERDSYRCSRCNATRGLQVHHIHEKQFGGDHAPENLRTLCRACHELVHAVVAMPTPSRVPATAPALSSLPPARME